MALSQEQIEEQKAQTRKQWNANPCGQVGDISYSPEYFLEVEHYRYDVYGDWMKDFYDYKNHQGVKLLEVGYGQGTDLVQYCLGGAECYGVDITDAHKTLAISNFKTRDLSAELFLEDAADMHFESSTFDKVVSFGVLHHTPDIEQCISEVKRVLTPGGEFVITLYHRRSAYWCFTKLLKEGLFKGKLFSLGLSGLKATIERGADGKNIKPYVKLYNRRRVTNLLKDFSSTSIQVKHLYGKNFWPLGRLLPKWFLKIMEPYLGWYIIAKAIK